MLKNGFLESTKVKVFPCAYRGMTEDNKIFNPEARLNTEKNFITNGSGISDLCTSYIVDWTQSLLVCVIAGYRFELNISAEELKNNFSNKDVYLKIKISDVGLMEGATTKILANLQADSSDLDNIVNDSTSSTQDTVTRYFTGLSFIAVDANSEVPTVNTGEQVLRILKADGTVDNLAKTPLITSGKGSNAVVLNEKLINKSATAADSNIVNLENRSSGDFSLAANKGKANGKYSAAFNFGEAGETSDGTLGWGATAVNYSSAYGNCSFSCGGYINPENPQDFNFTLAAGDSSFAGGRSSIATGISSFAFGSGHALARWPAEASGDYSLAIGRGTQAKGEASAAFNEALINGNLAFGANSAQVNINGVGAAAFNKAIANAENSFAANTSTVTGENAASFNESQVLAAKSAFAANGGNIAEKAEYSSAFNDATIYGKQAFAANKAIVGVEGDSTHSGFASAAFNKAIAAGKSAFAIGGSLADNTDNVPIAKGECSFAGGRGHTVANANYAFAFGREVIASTENQAAFGQFNTEDPDALFVVGNGTTRDNRANALTVSKNNSLAYGVNTKATGLNSFAGGDHTLADGVNAVAIGNSNTDIGVSPSGIRTAARGINSFALGSGCTAKGAQSVAFGTVVTANHSNSLAVGELLTTGAEDQVVIGKYNKIDSSAAFIIGNGNYDPFNPRLDSQKNIFTVEKTGKVDIHGGLTVSGGETIINGICTAKNGINSDGAIHAPNIVEGKNEKGANTSYIIFTGEIDTGIDDISPNPRWVSLGNPGKGHKLKSVQVSTRLTEDNHYLGSWQGTAFYYVDIPGETGMGGDAGTIWVGNNNSSPVKISWLLVYEK